MLDPLRYLVLSVFLVSLALAWGSWALTTRRINPLGRAARLIRRLSDPIIQPIEVQLLKRGSNPQRAPWWLLGITVVGGIVVITLTEWIVVQAARLTSAGAAGPRAMLRLALYYAGQLLSVALIARVIGSWVGVGRYNRWMRPAYLLTDWIVRPLRRIIPPLGFIDVTPIVAWFAIQLVLGWLMALI